MSSGDMPSPEDEHRAGLHRDFRIECLRCLDEKADKERSVELKGLRAQIEALTEQLDDINASYRRTVFDLCAPDEKHCSCVPALREEISSLRKAVENGPVPGSELERLLVLDHVFRTFIRPAVEEGIAMVHSGYDGVFMGRPVEALFSTLAVAERGMKILKKESPK